MSITAARLAVEVGADTSQAEAGIKGMTNKLNDAAKNLAGIGTGLSAAITLPLLGIAKAGLDSAAEFQQNMNILQQTVGASAAEMNAMQNEAIQLGAQTSFSAGEAASAMLELGKAGMSTSDIMEAIPGVLDLAAAGGVGLAEAADLTAAALHAFHLQASESGRVANLLAGAANASAADVSDLGQGMQQAGFAFANANQPIENLAASLAILTNVGLTGADAGTALKNAFMRMMNPTQQARDVMNDLGISFYDASGTMKALPDIIDMLNTATAGMTDQQRDAALSTIFMSDGLKAFLPLMDQGSAGFNKMVEAVSKQGSAADVAAARMSGLAGGIEYLKGSIDSALISTFLPFLDTLGNLARGTGDLITTFSALPQPVIDAALAFLGVLAAAGPVLLTLSGMAAGLAFLLSPIGLVVAATAGLAAAWAGDFGGIREVTEGTIIPAGESLRTLSGHLIDVVQNGDYLNRWLEQLRADAQPATEAIARIIASTQDLSSHLGDLRGGAIDIASHLKATVVTEIDWSQLKVNGAELVTRVGTSLSTLDWSQMVFSAEGLLSAAGSKITEQADKYLGQGNVIDRAFNRIGDTFSILQSAVTGANIDEPLDLLRRVIFGAMSISNLISGIKSDVHTDAINVLETMLTTVFSFGQKLAEGVNVGDIQKAALGMVTSFTNQVVEETKPEKLIALGTAAGSLIATVVTKLGNAFGDPKFGADVGAAVGQGTAAFATGALALAAGIVNQLSSVDFGTLETQIQTFTGNFLGGVATEIGKGDYAPLAGAIVTGIAKALAQIITANPLSIFNLGTSLGGDNIKPQGLLPGTFTDHQRDLINNNNAIEQVSWEQAGQWISSGFSNNLVWPAFTWPDLPTFEWPKLPEFTWPSIPVPDWLGSFLDKADAVESAIGSFFGSRSSSSGGGGGSGGGGPINDRPEQVDPDQNNFPGGLPGFATESNVSGGPQIYINFGGVTINDKMDLEALKYDLVQTIRRAL